MDDPTTQAAMDEHRLGAIALGRGQYVDASAHFTKSGEIYTALGRRSDAAAEFLYAGFAGESGNNLASALSSYEVARSLQRDTADTFERLSLLRRIGRVAAAIGDSERLQLVLDEVQSLTRDLSDEDRKQLRLEGTWDELRSTAVPGHRPALRLLSTVETDFSVLDRLSAALREKPSWGTISASYRVAPDLTRPPEDVHSGDTVVYELAPGSISPLLDQIAEIRLIEEVGAAVIPVIPPGMPTPEELLEFAPILGTLSGAFDEIVERLSVLPRVEFSRLSPPDFEALVADLLRAHGFTNIEHELDRRFDFAAELSTHEPFGIATWQRWIIEVRLYQVNRSRADLRTIRSFANDLDREPASTIGLFVTNGQLTSVTHKWVRDYQAIRQFQVIEGPDLRRLVAMRPPIVRRYFGLADHG